MDVTELLIGAHHNEEFGYIERCKGRKKGVMRGDMPVSETLASQLEVHQSTKKK